jgi:hypothetical protein
MYNEIAQKNFNIFIDKLCCWYNYMIFQKRYNVDFKKEIRNIKIGKKN